MVLVISITACSQQPEEVIVEESFVAVEVMQPQKGRISIQTTIGGQLTADGEAMVIPTYPGTVETLNVSVGDKVEAGDVLFTIDDSNVQLQIEQAEVAYTNTVVGRNIQLTSKYELQDQIIQAGYDRDDDLEGIDKETLETKIATVSAQISALMVSEATAATASTYSADDEAAYRVQLELLQTQQSVYVQELQGAYTAEGVYTQTKKQLEQSIKSLPFTEESLEWQLKQAEMGVKAAKAALKDMTVKAPIGGEVSAVTIYEGGLAGQQAAAVTITDKSGVGLKVKLSEYEVTKLKVGDTVELYIDAIKSTKTGIVEYVSPTIDLKTQSYLANVVVPNETSDLFPGMFAEATLILNQIDNAFVLPKSSVLADEAGPYVYVIDEDQPKKVKVVTGIDDGKNIAVTSGLSSLDQVVVVGQQYLSEGVKIKVVSDGEAK
jgi:RND family efflux transporter MFP subunit